MRRYGMYSLLILLIAAIFISLCVEYSPKVAALITLITAVCIAIRSRKRSIVLFVFMVSYIFFLVNPFSLNILFSYNNIFISSIKGHEQTVIYSLLIGMIAVISGYNVSIKNPYKTHGFGMLAIDDYSLISDDVDYDLLFSISKGAFYIAAICTVYICVMKRMFFLQYGYMAYHAEGSSITSGIPTIITKLASGLDLFAVICFATMRKMKRYKWVFIIYIATGAFELLFGVRTGVVVTLIVVYAYKKLREQERKRESAKNNWISGVTVKKAAMVSLCFGFVVFLIILGYTRSGTSLSTVAIKDILVNLAAGSSDTVNLFALAEKTDIGSYTSTLYSLGDFNLWVNNSFIGKYFLNRSYLDIHTEEMARSYYSFGQSIAYHSMRSSYLNGAAYGSSYIVENYVDGGYVGVFLGSFLYGILIRKIEEFKAKKIFGRTLMLLLISRIVYAPRAGFSGFIVEVFSFTYILFAAVVLVLYMLLKQWNLTLRTVTSIRMRGTS